MMIAVYQITAGSQNGIEIMYVDSDELSHNQNKCDISLSNTYQVFYIFGKLVANL